jgi:hypothetical protein
LGYTPDEVQQTLTEKIKAWKKEGAPGAPQE